MQRWKGGIKSILPLNILGKAMVILISGASHSGKTALAQKLLEKYHFPYLSIDRLKMGLIRSGQTELTPMSSDHALTEYLWLIVCEMIKTAIENKQNLIVEGCYITFNWEEDFEAEYQKQIRYCCIVLSEEYIHKHWDDMKHTQMMRKSDWMILSGEGNWQ